MYDPSVSPSPRLTSNALNLLSLCSDDSVSLSDSPCHSCCVAYCWCCIHTLVLHTLGGHTFGLHTYAGGCLVCCGVGVCTAHLHTLGLHTLVLHICAGAAYTGAATRISVSRPACCSMMISLTLFDTVLDVFLTQPRSVARGDQQAVAVLVQCSRRATVGSAAVCRHGQQAADGSSCIQSVGATGDATCELQ